MQSKSFFVLAGPLLLVLFIDGMGLGLVIPVLNGLIFDPNSQFLPANNFSPMMHNIIYGAIISIFMLCWFFGAAVLGDLSDQIGRKKSLIICLAGAFLSYVISAFAVNLSSLSLMILGRIIAGFTSGSQPIAQAAIIDLSTSKTKARNLGYILLSLSLGFIFGPLFGGLLSDKSIFPSFDFATPFYFAALVSFVNIILLWFLFNESFVSRSTTLAINPYQAINIFISAFKNEQIKYLSILFFIYIFGWSSYYSFVSLFLLKVYELSSTQVSLFMAVMGVGFGIGTGFVVNRLAAIFPLREIYIYCSILCAVIIVIMLLIPSALSFWVLVAPLACCISVSYTSILTLFSNAVDEKSQGWVMGITGSVMAFDWAVNGVIVGVAAAWNAYYPMYIAALVLFLAGILTFKLFKKS